MMSHRGEKSREKGGNNKIFQASILQEVCYTKTHHKKPPSQCRQISNRPAILLSMGHPSFPSLDVGFKPGLKNMMIHFPQKNPGWNFGKTNPWKVTDLHPSRSLPFGFWVFFDDSAPHLQSERFQQNPPESAFPSSSERSLSGSRWGRKLFNQILPLRIMGNLRNPIKNLRTYKTDFFQKDTLPQKKKWWSRSPSWFLVLGDVLPPPV